jgi:hypothetical protein
VLQVLHLRDEGFASLVEFSQGSCHGVITFGSTAAFPPTTKVRVPRQRGLQQLRQRWGSG